MIKLGVVVLIALGIYVGAYALCFRPLLYPYRHELIGPEVPNAEAVAEFRRALGIPEPPRVLLYFFYPAMIVHREISPQHWSVW